MSLEKTYEEDVLLELISNPGHKMHGFSNADTSVHPLTHCAPDAM
jgi:hypothetical protein